MTFTKLSFRVAAVLTVAAFAVPALPCSDAKQTQATFTPVPAAPAPATAEPVTTKTPKDAVAKQTQRPITKQQGRTSTHTKPTATN
jgi:hypothetical protein